MKRKQLLTRVGKTNDFKEPIIQAYRQSRSPEQKVSTKEKRTLHCITIRSNQRTLKVCLSVSLHPELIYKLLNVLTETRVFRRVAGGGGPGLTREAASSGPCDAAKLCCILIPVLFKFLSCKPQNQRKSQNQKYCR